MKTLELIIEGMTCGHCIMAVKQGLNSVPGVTVQDVAIGKAVVAYDAGVVKAEDLARAVEEAGYAVSRTNS